MTKNFKIPAPTNRPNYHEYAAGAPGDSRPIEKRFAERVACEDLAAGALQDPIILAALERAFNAGRFFERDVAGKR